MNISEVLDVLRRVRDHLRRTSEATLGKEFDFADYDLLEELENVIKGIEGGN